MTPRSPISGTYAKADAIAAIAPIIKRRLIVKEN
jgi:hypothetical protein